MAIRSFQVAHTDVPNTIEQKDAQCTRHIYSTHRCEKTDLINHARIIIEHINRCQTMTLALMVLNCTIAIDLSILVGLAIGCVAEFIISSFFYLLFIYTYMKSSIIGSSYNYIQAAICYIGLVFMLPINLMNDKINRLVRISFRIQNYSFWCLHRQRV